MTLDAGEGRQVGQLGAGARVDVDVDFGQQAGGLVPAREAGQVVGAHEQHELVAGVALAQGVEGGDGIAGARQAKFDVLGAQAWVAGEGQLHEAQALGFGQQVGGGLKGAVGRHDQPDFG